MTSLHKVTPRSVRSVGNGSSLTKTRGKIADEMDTEMLTCSLDDFQKSYLPFIPDEHDVRACAMRLVNIKMLDCLQGNKYRWRDITPPDETKEKETAAFKFIKKIASAVAEHKFLDTTGVAGRLEQPQLKYEDCPNRSVWSEILGADFKVDGCFKLQELSGLSTGETGKVTASDAAVVAEFKKGSNSVEDAVDNRLKIVSAASHIMNDDPRRGFMFGITVEGRTMSLWYFSRSHSTKSEGFDYIEEPTKLISVFLSFLFGNTIDLGYDPAVRRVGGSRIYYEYDIRSQDGTVRHYRTYEALSGYRALGITGRMTRVWKAKEIWEPRGEVKDNKEVALKDVWLDIGAQTERSIQNQIFAAIERDDQEKIERLKCLPPLLMEEIEQHIKNKTYRQYFMTIDWDQDKGMTTKLKPESAIPAPGLFSSVGAKSLYSRSHQLPGSSNRSRPTPARHPSSHTSNGSEGIENRTYVPKNRYLLIYSDVGKALHDTGDLQTVFMALGDALYALALMFIANWVHRDVSTGNIVVLGVGDETRGKLSDLEYAKQFNSETPISLDPKTGTPFLMAHEMLSGTVLKINVKEKNAGFTLVRGPNGKLQTSLVPRLPSPPDELIYNIQHDLESLWWIALWFLVDRVDYEPSRTFARRIFVNRIGPIRERGQIFQNQSQLVMTLYKVLHEELYVFVSALEEGRSDLVASYISRENIFDPASYKEIFESMLKVIIQCYQFSNNIQDVVLLAPTIGVNLEPSSMDPLPDSTSDGPQKRALSSNSSSEDNDGVEGRKRLRQDDLPRARNPERRLFYPVPTSRSLLERGG